MTINSIDVTSFCISTIGIVLLVAYLGFAYSLTHQEDFYKARRWKAALWFAGIPSLILFAILLWPSIMRIVNGGSGASTVDLIETMIASILSTLATIIPLLFVLTIGTHYQFKWWLNSDVFLEKFWKDPHPQHKNPIQDL